MPLQNNKDISSTITDVIALSNCFGMRRNLRIVMVALCGNG